MPSRELSFPVFDADNHMYETQEALTKYLPDRASARSTTSTSAAAPRSSSAARSATTSPTRPSRSSPAGRAGGLLPQRQPRGQDLPGDPGQADEGDPGVPRAGAPPRADGRARHRPRADVPHARQPGRGAHEGRPGAHPRRHPCAERVDVRAVDRSTTRTASSPRRSSPCRSSTGRSKSSSGVSSAAPAPCSSGPRRSRVSRARVIRRCQEFDPFWQACVRPTSRCRCTRPTAATPNSPTSGSQRRVHAVQADRLPLASRWAIGRSRTRWPRSSATARCPATPTCESCRSRTAPTGCRTCSSPRGVYKKMPQAFSEDPIEAFKRGVYISPFWEDNFTESSTGRRRPRAFRVRLAPPRGPEGPDHLRRRPGRPHERTSPRSWAGT